MGSAGKSRSIFEREPVKQHERRREKSREEERAIRIQRLNRQKALEHYEEVAPLAKQLLSSDSDYAPSIDPILEMNVGAEGNCKKVLLLTLCFYFQKNGTSHESDSSREQASINMILSLYAFVLSSRGAFKMSEKREIANRLNPQSLTSWADFKSYVDKVKSRGLQAWFREWTSENLIASRAGEVQRIVESIESARLDVAELISILNVNREMINEDPYFWLKWSFQLCVSLTALALDVLALMTISFTGPLGIIMAAFVIESMASDIGSLICLNQDFEEFSKNGDTHLDHTKSQLFGEWFETMDQFCGYLSMLATLGSLKSLRRLAGRNLGPGAARSLAIFGNVMGRNIRRPTRQIPGLALFMESHLKRSQACLSTIQLGVAAEGIYERLNEDGWQSFSFQEKMQAIQVGFGILLRTKSLLKVRK